MDHPYVGLDTCVHAFVLPTLLQERKTKINNLHQVGEVVWTVDPLPIFKLVLDESRATDISPEFSVGAVLKLLLSDVARHVKFLVCCRTGERVSLSNVAERTEFRNARRDTLEDLILQRLEYLNTLDDEVAEEIDEDYLRLVRQLSESYDQKDLSQCHLIMQVITVREITQSLEMEMVTVVRESCLQEECLLLLGVEQIFARAEAEYTLGTIDVERRIAVNLVYEHMQSVGEITRSEQSEQLIDLAIAEFLRKRDVSKRRLAQLVDLDVPDQIIRDEEYLLKKRRYFYLSLKKNRSWLIAFFAR